MRPPPGTWRGGQMVALTHARQLHVVGSPFPAALPGHRGPTTSLRPGGTAHGAQGRMRAGAAGHDAAPSSPLCPQPVACPWPLKQGPGKLRCSQAMIPKASPKFPPRLLSPAETLLLFGDSLSRWEGTGPCWEVTASLGGARAGGNQPGRLGKRGGCPPTCLPSFPLQPACPCPIAAGDPRFCSGPHAPA